MIQWRKFRLKMSCTLRDMNFWSSRPFLNFIWFLIWFLRIFPIWNYKNIGFLPTGADVASGPRWRLTWCAGPPRGATRHWGHVAEPERPTRGARVALTCGQVPRGRPWGAPRGERGWWVEGPRVSGPWLVFRGGNAIGVYRPLIYRGAAFFFFRVGLCPTRHLSLQVTWRLIGRSMQPERRRSRGPESTRSSTDARAQYILSDQSTVAAWKYQVRAIVIATGIVIWEHRTAYLTPRGGSRAPDLHRDNRRSDGWCWTRRTIKA